MSQQVDVAEGIAELLMEQGQAVLPGLGKFVGTYEPARADQLLGLVEPPSLQVKFYASNTDEDESLAAWICSKYKVTSVEASQLLEEFTRRTKTLLQKKELVSIPKVGRLRLDFEGNLQFLSDTDNLNLDAFGLPTFHAFPIKRSTPAPAVPPASEAVAATPSPEGTNKVLYGKGRLNAGWLLGVGILAGTILVYILLRPKIGAFVSESIIRKEKQSSDVLSKSATVPIKRSSNMQEMDTTQLDTPAITQVPVATQRTCIIGLGVFREQRNIDKLINKIQAAGYVSYTEQVGTLTRVGIQFTYTHEDEVAEKLALIQGKLEPAAVILKK